MPVEAPVVVKVDTSSPEYIKSRIHYYAEKYGVSEITLNSLINCESGYNPDIDGDNGTSHGLAQIHITKTCHTDITEAQAHNIEFSLDFMAKEIKAGNGHIWSCWKNR